MTERLAHPITLGDRAALLGLSYRDQLELERAEPWVRAWPGRFGAGAERLRDWIVAGRPVANRAELCIAGDDAIVRVVREVLAKLPEAVAHFLVGNAMVFCTGINTRGWCGELPAPPCERPHVVLLSTDAAGVVAHELAHAWHRRPLPGKWLTAAERARVAVAAVEVATERGEREASDALAMQAERAADALARAWGFEVDTTSGHLGEIRRARIRGEEYFEATRALGQARRDLAEAERMGDNKAAAVASIAISQAERALAESRRSRAG